jgi:hypothetical protein
MTGGVTMHTAAAWRTEVTCSGRLSTGTLAGLYPSLTVARPWEDTGPLRNAYCLRPQRKR